MLMNRRAPAFGRTLWCLLCLWTFFGSLELAEQYQVVPESAAEDQARQDLDEAGLLQLVSGLKSDNPNLSVPCCVSVTAVVAELGFSLAVSTVHQRNGLMLHGPPTQPLYQQLCVYRI